METLDHFPEFLYEQYTKYRKDVPSMIKSHRFTENIINFLFPFKIDRKCTLPQIELNLAQLQIDFKDLIGALEGTISQTVNEVTLAFFEKIPRPEG